MGQIPFALFICKCIAHFPPAKIRKWHGHTNSVFHFASNFHLMTSKFIVVLVRYIWTDWPLDDNVIFMRIRSTFPVPYSERRFFLRPGMWSVAWHDQDHSSETTNSLLCRLIITTHRHLGNDIHLIFNALDCSRYNYRTRVREFRRKNPEYWRVTSHPYRK